MFFDTIDPVLARKIAETYHISVDLVPRIVNKFGNIREIQCFSCKSTQLSPNAKEFIPQGLSKLNCSATSFIPKKKCYAPKLDINAKPFYPGSVDFTTIGVNILPGAHGKVGNVTEIQCFSCEQTKLSPNAKEFIPRRSSVLNCSATPFIPRKNNFAPKLDINAKSFYPEKQLTEDLEQQTTEQLYPLNCLQILLPFEMGF